MTLAELHAALETLGLPVINEATDVPVGLPYIIHAFAYGSDFNADNKIYALKSNYQVELYTKHRDQAKERDIVALLNENRVQITNRIGTRINDDKIYQMIFEVLIDDI